jgi:hypothetical protein
MSDDDQYREYGSSERDRQTPGYFRALVNAFSGTGNENRPTLAFEENLATDEDKSSMDEASGEPELNPELVGVSVAFDDANMLKSKVTDEKFSLDNSSESSRRISNRQIVSNYDASESRTIPFQTDFRGGLSSTVGHLPDHGADLYDGFYPQQESSGGENFMGGNHSIRRSIGSIHNVTIRESKRPKDRQQDRDYRRTSFPTSHQFSLLPSARSRATDTTPEPESAGEYEWNQHAPHHVLGNHFGRG